MFTFASLFQIYRGLYDPTEIFYRYRFNKSALKHPGLWWNLVYLYKVIGIFKGIVRPGVYLLFKLEIDRVLEQHFVYILKS